MASIICTTTAYLRITEKHFHDLATYRDRETTFMRIYLSVSCTAAAALQFLLSFSPCDTKKKKKKKKLFISLSLCGVPVPISLGKCSNGMEECLSQSAIEIEKKRRKKIE